VRWLAREGERAAGVIYLRYMGCCIEWRGLHRVRHVITTIASGGLTVDACLINFCYEAHEDNISQAAPVADLEIAASNQFHHSISSFKTHGYFHHDQRLPMHPKLAPEVGESLHSKLASPRRQKVTAVPRTSALRGPKTAYSFHFPCQRKSLRPCAGLFLPRFRVVVEGNANGPSMMPVILPDDLSSLEFPQPGIVVATNRDKVGRVGGEGAIPDPTLVGLQDDV